MFEQWLVDELKGSHFEDSQKARQLEILSYRLGLFGQAVHTLEDSAARFGITRERVRQIESYYINRFGRYKLAHRHRRIKRDFYFDAE